MLTTLSVVKGFLNIPVDVDEQDVIVNRFIQAADDFVKLYCNRQFEAAAYTEYHSGHDGQTVLALKEYPINSITSIHDDSLRAYGPADLIDPSRYVYDPAGGLITLTGGTTFEKSVNNIQVIYNGGFTTTPSDLEQAVVELIASKYHASDKIRQGIVTRSFNGESVTYFFGAILPEIEMVLKKYQRVTFW